MTDHSVVSKEFSFRSWIRTPTNRATLYFKCDVTDNKLTEIKIHKKGVWNFKITWTYL